jgi:hypothetical protein
MVEEVCIDKIAKRLVSEFFDGVAWWTTRENSGILGLKS